MRENMIMDSQGPIPIPASLSLSLSLSGSGHPGLFAFPVSSPPHPREGRTMPGPIRLSSPLSTRFNYVYALYFLLFCFLFLLLWFVDWGDLQVPMPG